MPLYINGDGVKYNFTTQAEEGLEYRQLVPLNMRAQAITILRVYFLCSLSPMRFIKNPVSVHHHFGCTVGLKHSPVLFRLQRVR
jgi:hypothetical protein